MYISEEIENKMKILVKCRLMKRKEQYLTGEKGRDNIKRGKEKGKIDKREMT